MNISVALLASPELVQVGLRALLEEVDPNIKVTFLPANEGAFIAAIKHGADIAIIDIGLYDELSLQGVFENAEQCEEEVVVLGVDVVPDQLSDQVSYLCLTWPASQLKDKLHTIVASRKEALGGAGSEEVTARERDIIRDIALGLSSKEIAEKNYISPHTVITHRKNISRKLGIKSISGLTIYAIVNKLISLEDVKENEKE